MIIFLLIASYFFYMSWNPLYIGLIISSSILDFICGKMIFKCKKIFLRKTFLITSLTGNLGLLFLFKYYNFFIGSFNIINDLLGMSINLPHSNLLLPVGISFYTFQTLSYTLDIYRKKLEPVKSIWQFALFVSFFPQLVAGPIVRASYFLPQLKRRNPLNSKNLQGGMFLILIGLFKKVVIADFLAMNIVDRVFDVPLLYSGLENLIAIYAYALQIFNDFSGYSDIAIGSALLLGFKLPENFNAPYIASNLRDFWRRWHISLSTWLRDYLYIFALGGSRKGKVRTHFNLLITMLLGGLWHGAGWNFVIWGALHGTGLAVTRFFQNRNKNKSKKNILIKFFSIFITFHFVCFCWIFFRAQNLETVIIILKNLLEFDTSYIHITLPIIGVIVLGYILHFIPGKIKLKTQDIFIKMPSIIQVFIMLIITSIIYIASSSKAVPFIYFQF